MPPSKPQRKKLAINLDMLVGIAVVAIVLVLAVSIYSLRGQ